MTMPAHLPVYREPLKDCSSMQTYTWHISPLCQLHWDYSLDWPTGVQPRIWVFAYRCYQRAEAAAEFQLVDSVPLDIPVWEDVIRQISRQLAEELYATAKIVGPIVPASPDYPIDAEEAAKKRYDMSKYRKQIQGPKRSS
jgi:hypothetical protein